ncbi:DUF4114 domain-containing protein [Ancylomarina sp. 16SWW S1-10-2]|uniref:DUF4114 domain-containing protein n=1 Tax=Ancylomarina sp. 16SWW S1-10-2 TaxID=2499681 RepID=UPI0012AEB13F|nr:DUF4114 domain-containing protein [Ancylomarina sp. 16SWW S1-10-2]MRT93187.1 DUF4114 domain-containing protein [Ancylomarina sp. 16SWW S1-10-2]
MRKYLLLLTAVFIIISSCSDNHDNEKGVAINNDTADLSSRVTTKNTLVIINNLPASKTKAGTEVDEIDYTKNYAFTLRAEVEAPKVDGEYVQSTHVKIVDNMAFVSYNTKGDVYRGGVELFDISDPITPVLKTQALFPNMDVSSVEYYDGVIYLVGALDPDSEDYLLESPAVLITLELSDSQQILSVSDPVDMPSFVATDIAVDDAYVYVTSGSAGGLSVLNRSDLSLVKDMPMDDVRSLSINTNNIYALSADESIHSFNKTNFTELENIAIGNISDESKTEIDATDEYIFAALNKSGLDIRNLDGTLKEHFNRPETAEGGLDADYVTNSVSLNGELLLIGNGAAGIYVGAMVPENDDAVTMLGSMDLSGSANFVESQGNYIFVAAGTGGLKILTFELDEGLPEEIIPTKPCETLVENIIKMFPEYTDNRSAYPELFNDENNLILKLTKESPVYLTFVDEGAGWKNSLAYYTYDADNIPESADEIELHMLFPNASKEGSGGGLKAGDRVQLGDSDFPENTVIGFCLIANGWKNGATTDGNYRHYTNIELNDNVDGQKQQHTLFIEQGCKDIVLCFEDARLPGGDIDFNDIIFTVNDNETDANVATAFDLTNIVEL